MADVTPSSASASPVAGALQVARQLGDLWKRQPKSRRLIAIAIVVGVIGVVGWTMIGHRVETWSAAIDGLAPDDAQELLAALNGRGVAARLREGKVEVRDADLDQARAIAASAGLPFAGKGFELFDGNSLGQSSFAEQVNYRRALQGELARSITALAQVESARVHVAIGRHSVFKDQEVAPSASVALHLHLGQTLSADQVRGVRQLVAASVEGLKPEAVAVLDGHGNLLEGPDPSSASHAIAIEHTVSERVQMMLERVVGVGHVSVVASADLDARQISETEDVYDKDRAVVRSESRTIDGADPSASTGGIAGVRGNLPGATPASPAAAGSGAAAPSGHTQETRNFEISHKVVQTTNPEQTLRRLHVAVLIDELKGKDGKPIVRTPAELAELTALARQAAGIDDARGDVIEVRSVSFAPTDDIGALAGAGADAAAQPSLLPLPLPILVGAGAGALVVLVLIVLVVRSSRRRRRQQQSSHVTLAFPTPIAELERVLDARAQAQTGAGALPPMTDLPALPPGRSIQERVTEVVRADVDRAAGVLTAWLAQTVAPTPAKATK